MTGYRVSTGRIIPCTDLQKLNPNTSSLKGLDKELQCGTPFVLLSTVYVVLVSYSWPLGDQGLSGGYLSGMGTAWDICASVSDPE